MRKFTKYPSSAVTASSNDVVYELKAQPLIYLRLQPGETQEQAVDRMTKMLYDAGFDILNSTLTVENTEIDEQ